MTGELEILDERGERTRCRVAGQPLLVQGGSLRVVPIAGGVRIESPEAGQPLRIHGQDLLCKDLADGQSVDVGRVRVTWFDDGAAAPAGARGGRARAGRDGASAGRRPSRRSPTSTWPAVLITVAVLGVALFVLRRLGNSTWPRSPMHYVELAQIQYDNNRPERALETLEFALKEATGEAKDRALALQRDIRRLMLENAAALEVSAARREHGLLESFVQRYLGQPERPAARELVRLCDDWMDEYGELCEWHPDGKPLRAAVTELRGRYVGDAGLGTPETAADVVFAARSRLRFQWRDYRGAMARIDAFLGRNPDAAEVRAEREQLLRDGAEWLGKRLRRIDAALQRGDTGNAERDLDNIDRWVALPEWQAEIEQRRKRLEAQR
ncbi:MAG: hypothetical protein ACE37K_10090 [Planctomycetota bacterium]